MSETTNLKLFKHDNPSTNTNLFDIDKSLNQNWDKIDTAFGITNETLQTEIETRQTKDSDLQEQISVAQTRIDNIANLPEGSTTGDAELIDGRVSNTGMIYKNIGESIRNQTEQDFKDFENYAHRLNTFNIFNKNDILIGRTINSTGELTDNSNYFTSNYMDVSSVAGETLYYNITGNKAFYTANKEFISYSSYLHDTGSISVPSNAKYIRISLQLNMLNRLCVSFTNFLLNEVPYYDYDFLYSDTNKFINLKQMINTQIKNLFNEFNNYGTRTRTNNLFNKNDIIENYYLANNSYSPVYNESYFISNFVNVENVQNLYINYMGNHYFYDGNKMPIAYGSYSSSSPLTVPTGAKYFRISLNKSYLDKLTIGTEDIIPTGTPYYNYHIDQITDIPKNIHTANIFKKVVCCGDSYTSGYIVDSEGVSHDTYDFSWPAFMENITGNKYINCSLGGRNVLTWQTSSPCLPKARTSGKSQAYIIGLMLNDISDSDRHVDLGTINDIGTEAQTYYGGMSKIVSELLTISPNAKIFIQTCPRTDGNFPSYNQAVRDIVSYYRQTNTNIHCLDLVNYIDLYNTTSLTGDSWHGHYTAMGYEQFAEILNYILSDYINNHISEFRDVAFIEYDE